MPTDCQIVEAAEKVHYKLAQIAQQVGVDEDELTRIGDLTVGRDTIEWRGGCTRCLGEVSVKHNFTDGAEQSIEIKLPDTCPRKPRSEDSPTLFYVERQRPRQQG